MKKRRTPSFFANPCHSTKSLFRFRTVRLERHIFVIAKSRIFDPRARLLHEKRANVRATADRSHFSACASWSTVSNLPDSCIFAYWSKPISEIDLQLYKKYGLTPEETAFIETNIKPME